MIMAIGYAGVRGCVCGVCEAGYATVFCYLRGRGGFVLRTAAAYSDTAAYMESLLRLARLRLSALALFEAKADASVYDEAARFAAHMQKRFEATMAQDRMIGLEYAFARFELSDFARHCVTLALAAELDGGIGDALARLQGDGTRLPTVRLCIQSFTPDESERLRLAQEPWDALETYFFPTAQGDVLASRLDYKLKLNARMRGFAMDMEREDDALAAYTTLYWPWEPAPDMLVNSDIPARMDIYYEATPRRLFFLYGPAGAGRLLCARRSCLRQNLPLLVADMRKLPTTPAEFAAALTAAFREGQLRSAAVCLRGFTEMQKNDALLHAFLDALRDGGETVFVLAEEKWQTALDLGYTFVTMEVPAPGASERLLCWRAILGTLPLATDVSLAEVAAKFSFTPGMIADAARNAVLLMRERGRDALDSETLHETCRTGVFHRLGERATAISVHYAWEDLILPPAAKELLRNACDQVRFGGKVYGDWGFGQKIAYGRGVSMLFAGPPGTGKTMGAQVVANELKLEIYKVDLSAVVSKYIGETEKNLSEVFTEVKKSQSILFFDEADALFGKRTEVKDSHDKYANMETAYLLQKMEEYEGIVILASNYLQNFDDAFRRRIKFLVEFPFPDAEYREKMWRAVFPTPMPVATGIDYRYLAESFQFSGSSIKNVAVAAAFLAARDDTPVGMEHVLRAVLAEARKAGMNIMKEDLKEYYYIL